MIYYYIPLILLALLSTFENLNKFKILIKSSFFYYLFALLLILFLGLRFEIGCDWDQYLQMFEKYSTMTFKEMFLQNFLNNQNHTLQEFGHIFLTTISGNIYVDIDLYMYVSKDIYISYIHINVYIYIHICI